MGRSSLILNQWKREGEDSHLTITCTKKYMNTDHISVKPEFTFWSSESGVSFYTETGFCHTSQERIGVALFPQTEEDLSLRALTHTDTQPWAAQRMAASRASSPTRPPSLWWSRAGLWASSTGSYSCSSSLILSGQYCVCDLPSVPSAFLLGEWYHAMLIIVVWFGEAHSLINHANVLEVTVLSAETLNVPSSESFQISKWQ